MAASIEAERKNRRKNRMTKSAEMTEGTPSNRFRKNLKGFFRKFPDFSIRPTRHAQERMQKWAIELPQIWMVLERGSVQQVEADIRTGSDKYRVMGRDADGRTLEIVVNLDETGEGRIIVVTVIDSGSTRGA